MSECYSDEEVAKITPQVCSDLSSSFEEMINGKDKHLPLFKYILKGTYEKAFGTMTTVTTHSPNFRTTIIEPKEKVKFGFDVYSYAPSVFRGQSYEICVRQSKSGFKKSLVGLILSVEQSLRKVLEADLRSTMVKYGVKHSIGCNQGNHIYDSIQFDGKPKRYLTRKDFIEIQQSFLEIGEECVFYGSHEAIEVCPFEKIVCGRPLRASNFNKGVPSFIEPEIACIPTTNGLRPGKNKRWCSGEYEIGIFLFGKTIAMETPETGSARIEFVNIRDFDCNIYGDLGTFIYQIERAYKPLMPQNIFVVAYKRRLTWGQKWFNLRYDFTEWVKKKWSQYARKTM